MSDLPKSRADWGALEAGLESAQPFPASVEMAPAQARVREATNLSFTIRPTEGPIPKGTDLLTLVPKTWKLNLNGAFPEISKFFAVWEGGWGNGRQCLVAAFPSTDSVRATCELVPVGFEFLIHIRIEESDLPAGEALQVFLAHPDGPQVRTPQTAQFHPLVTAIRPGGNGAFLPLSDTPGLALTGAHAASIRVSAQAIVDDTEEAKLKLVPLDVYNLNRGCDFAGSLILSEPDIGVDQNRVQIGEGDLNVRTSMQLSRSEPFRHVLVRSAKGDLHGRSNPIGRPEQFGGYRIFFGDVHVHCRPCDGFGTMREAFDHAFEVSDLDFASVSHQQNSKNYPFNRTDWETYLDLNEEYNDREDFATMPICETYSSFGHRHSLFATREDALQFPVGPDHWGPQYEAGNTPEKLWQTLEGLEAITFPHHMKFIHATDFTVAPNPRDRVMEICSRWGIGETGGCHSAQHALSQGRRMGFVGGTDNQLGQPGSGTHGYNEGRGWTAVLADDLSRPAIYEAIKSRRCYATTGARMLLFVSLGDRLMGEEIAGFSGARTFTIRAAGTHIIDRLEVIRNGTVVYTEIPKTDAVETAYTDDEPLETLYRQAEFPNLDPFCYYYVRVTQRDLNQSWSSPIWLSSGTH